MEEKIGRETLQKLLELQIELLDKYKEVLASNQRKAAKKAVNDILKTIIAAVEPVSAFQHLAYDKTVELHEEAVEKTQELLNLLLEDEQARARLHRRMEEEAAARARAKQ